MATTSVRIFSFCSLLMAFLFASSASVQLNDHDWYFWFPLYASACVVNLLNWSIITSETKTRTRQIAKVALVLGLFLFLKVVIQGFMSGSTTAGVWSLDLDLDLSETLVREKTGSGLVVVSMILHLQASSPVSKHHPTARKTREMPAYVACGMALLVIFSFGLPFVFFGVQHGEMKLSSSQEE